MTDQERELLNGVKTMEEQAPSLGLCAYPFRKVYDMIDAIIRERDELAKYRTPASVEEITGWSGKCPTCGAVFMDAYTNYCGNCGQRITF